jgi:hypothetical protein
MAILKVHAVENSSKIGFSGNNRQENHGFSGPIWQTW